MKSIQFILTFGLFALLFVGCEVDGHKVEQSFYVQPEAEILIPNNPKTDLPYSADELVALDFDPLKENFYTKDQSVVLKVKMTTRPESVALINGSVANTTPLTDITEVDGAYVVTLSTNPLELAIDQGESRGIAFQITYPSENARGLVVENITYKVNRLIDPRVFNSYVFFEGVVQSFSGIGQFATVDETGIDLSFRYDGDFTVSIWAKSTVDNSDPSIIADKDWGSGGNKGFVFSYRGSRDWKVNAGDGAGNRIDISGPAMNDGNWHLLTVTFDRDGDAVLYHDLVEIDRKNMSALGNMDSGLPINIAEDGRGDYGSRFGLPFLGETREAYMHDVAMTKQELLDFYQ